MKDIFTREEFEKIKEKTRGEGCVAHTLLGNKKVKPLSLNKLDKNTKFKCSLSDIIIK